MRLWLTEGIPFAFGNYPVAYEEMRGWLGARLTVCPKQITLLGSGRIGFSLTRARFGRPFGHDSDLDLSIVSDTLFHRFAEAFGRWKQDYSEGAIRPRNDTERTYWNQNLQFGEKNLPLGFF